MFELIASLLCDGDAWVFENAQVFGNAWVSGGEGR